MIRLRLALAAPMLAAVVLVTACSRLSTDVSTSSVGPALPLEHPPVGADGLPGTSRQTRRLSVSQLRGSFPVVLGNDAAGKPITWMTSGTPGFDQYARTLGEPDYLLSTDENIEPSPLYAKFMDDAARDACDQTLAADEKRRDPSQRVLTRFVDPNDSPDSDPEGFARNLRYLKLRFHGVKLADTASIAPLEALFTKARAASGGDPREAWRAVCVALLTAPEFHLY